MGLGLVYEIANVISVYLQKSVAEMSNKQREVGDVVMDFSKFSEVHLKKESFLDDPLVKKVLQGTPIGDEERWVTDVCLIPVVSILTRLYFRMEGITELVNDTFIEDLSTLLSSCAEGKNCKTNR
jgi:hypothetical protein